ncbi:MAG: hypothetical protein ACKODY_06735, partial [Actinomycetota bacterium]
ALYGALDEEGQDAMQHIAGIKGTEFDDAGLADAIRTSAAKGRINGDLERSAIVLTEACLDDCVEALGSAAEDPSEGQLLSVLPDIVKKHGVATSQVMLASVICGEAVAAPIITRILKSNDVLKLPPAEAITTAPVIIEKESNPERDALKEQRKAKRAAEQEAARRRREQSARARRK